MDKSIVAEEDEGIRLDRWFKRHHPGVPHGLLEKHLRKGLIRLGGKKAKSSDRIEAGQEISFPEADVKIQAEKPARIFKPDDVQFIQNLVLYKDANIIVLNKPFGLPVQGGSKIARSLDDLLDGLRFEATERPKLVHRLDRDTSGCLVLARSTAMAGKLMKLFSSRQVEKIYWALVNGSPLPPFGTIDQPLKKKDNPKAMANRVEGRDYEIMQIDPEGQRAITDYNVLDTLARKFALVELKPLTGRTHQLRVHMQSIGCPILGDHKYGGGTEEAASLGVENILHLHARRIKISPLNVDVSAPLPPHMKKSFQALGLDVPKER